MSCFVVVGHGPTGERRIVPILGGTVVGPRLSGDILPGGADYQLIRPDGVAEIEARYTLRLALTFFKGLLGQFVSLTHTP